METRHIKYDDKDYQVSYLVDYKSNVISYIFSHMYNITLTTGQRTKAAESLSHGIIPKTTYDPVTSIVNEMVRKKILITPDKI